MCGFGVLMLFGWVLRGWEDGVYLVEAMKGGVFLVSV